MNKKIHKNRGLFTLFAIFFIFGYFLACFCIFLYFFILLHVFFFMFRNEYMYEILLNNGCLLNASIKEDENLSCLWYSFAVIKDFELTKDLMSRGCKINTEEVSKLSQLYVNFAIQDSIYINDKNYKKHLNNRLNRLRFRKSIKVTGLQLANALANMSGKSLNETKAYKTSIISNLLGSNLLHRKCIIDLHKNNAIHLYIINPIISLNSGIDSNDIGAVMKEQQKIIRLLKLEVCLF